jgi:hypothetical protein
MGEAGRKRVLPRYSVDRLYRALLLSAERGRP